MFTSPEAPEIMAYRTLWQAKDSTIMEFPNNGRGDDFAVIVLNDSTLMMSQSKRPGTASNLHLFTVIPPEPQK